MAVVVSDTSPLRALAFLNLGHLLSVLFDEVFIPPTVLAELRRSIAGQAPVDPAAIPGLRVRAPADPSGISRLEEWLDPGEAEAICLALEIKADALLIDEAQGRAYVKSHGLVVVGVLGLLVRAKRRGRIGPIAPLLDRLQADLRFFIAPSLRIEALRQAGEC